MAHREYYFFLEFMSDNEKKLCHEIKEEYFNKGKNMTKQQEMSY